MAFTLQNSDGAIIAANAYIDVAVLRAFALDRGVDLSAQADAALQTAIVKATDFLDTAFRFVGYQKNPDQGTAWPRLGLISYRQTGLPAALLKACSQLALRAAQGTVLSADPTTDSSGLVVSSKTDKVGPLESTVAFFAPPDGASERAMSRRFPDVELGLKQAGLISSSMSGTLSRA